MEDRISFKWYRSKKIHIVDYSDLALGDLGKLMALSKRKIIESEGTDLLLLEIVRRIKVNKHTSSSLRKYTTAINPSISKYAVVGATGATKIFIKTLRVLKIIDSSLWDTEKEALTYLAE